MPPPIPPMPPVTAATRRSAPGSAMIMHRTQVLAPSAYPFDHTDVGRCYAAPCLRSIVPTFIATAPYSFVGSPPIAVSAVRLLKDGHDVTEYILWLGLYAVHQHFCVVSVQECLSAAVSRHLHLERFPADRNPASIIPFVMARLVR